MPRCADDEQDHYKGGNGDVSIIGTLATRETALKIIPEPSKSKSEIGIGIGIEIEYKEAIYAISPRIAATRNNPHSDFDLDLDSFIVYHVHTEGALQLKQLSR